MNDSPKTKLDEQKIINKLSKGEMKNVIGGKQEDPKVASYPNDCLLACGTPPQSACSVCQV